MDADGFTVVKTNGRRKKARNVNTKIHKTSLPIEIDVDSTTKKIVALKHEMTDCSFVTEFVKSLREVDRSDNSRQPICRLHCYGLGQLRNAFNASG